MLWMSHFALRRFEIWVSKAASYQCQEHTAGQPFGNDDNPKETYLSKLKKLIMLELLLFQDKRKIQEEISQKRLRIEEEKLKHQHLKVIYEFNFISMILYSNSLLALKISMVKML